MHGSRASLWLALSLDPETLFPGSGVEYVFCTGNSMCYLLQGVWILSWISEALGFYYLVQASAVSTLWHKTKQIPQGAGGRGGLFTDGWKNWLFSQLSGHGNTRRWAGQMTGVSSYRMSVLHLCSPALTWGLHLASSITRTLFHGTCQVLGWGPASHWQDAEQTQQAYHSECPGQPYLPTWWSRSRTHSSTSLMESYSFATSTFHSGTVLLQRKSGRMIH